MQKRVPRWLADAAHDAPEPGGNLTHVFDRFGMEIPYRVLAAEPGERLVPKGRPWKQSSSETAARR